MPRIVPIQLLKCLKVLLNVNGGILSTGEVRRIATLMSKYSKKLVSKCIYVQILKCTDTELLDEFMAVGGWNLVYTWLTDGIRLTNWPLVQEILELLLLCPVDVNRLKINSAPKLVKSLSAGYDEGVCILAQRLVEQWLKIVTEGNENQQQQQRLAALQQPSEIDTNQVQPNLISKAIAKPEPDTQSSRTESPVPVPPPKIETKVEISSDVEENVEEDVEEDPLAIPDETVVPKDLTPTIAQKKATKAGLVYKIVVRNGQQLLTKVESKPDEIVDDAPDVSPELDENDAIIEEDVPTELVEDSTSLDKPEDKESGESESTEDKKIDEKKSTEIKNNDTEKSPSKEQREHRKSKDETTKEYKSEKDKEKDKGKQKERRSSSSSHRSSSSSSSHKSSSKTSTSSSSKSKASSSSTSVPSPTSRRSSSDKHRSDKDRSSSSSSSNKDKDKDKERNNSSSSSKHKSSSSSSKSSSSSSSKDRHREKDKTSSSSSSFSTSSKKDKEREKDLQAEKDKDTLSKMLPPSLDKLGKIPKKIKDEKSEKSPDTANNSINKPTSITIPSKKASMSIEIRRDTEKTNTVKTYKSQFRSHGLTEEAPPPPSRKTLKKPSSSTSTIIPTSLPSSLKRPSPPPRDTPTEKKAKIDINQITPAAANVEKPGAIKLIPAKRIQTLVETNIFSDALAAATGPKKVSKRKRLANSHKDEPATPTSPDAPKVAPLKFYQDTLDESAKAANEDKSDKSKDDETNNNNSNNNADTDKENNASVTDEDDDIPLKKVKEDIEQRVRKEKAAANVGDTIEITSDPDEEGKATEKATPEVENVRKPGPGCGPDGPPGVLMLHRRKGPKKKLTWRPQEQLEQVRYFELDENERVNVMKVSFHDMKSMERFNERASLTNLTKRGPRPGDIQEPRTEWRPLFELDDVPVHPDGAQSKERKVQAEREMTTLRALYFSPNMIPDSPSEAEIEPHFPGDPPTIPLDDTTGNQDAINDFSGMPWPEPKGSPKHGDNLMSGTGGLGGLGNPAAEMFPGVLPNNPGNMKNQFINNNSFMGPFGGNGGPGPNNMPPGPVPQQMPPMPPNGWQGPPKNPQVPIISNAFSLHPNADMMSGGPNFIPQHNQFNGPPPFMHGRNTPFGPPPPPGFNGPNFNQMGPGNPMGGPMSNNMGPVPLMNGMNNGPRGGNMNRNNWVNGPNNFQDNNNMNNGNWRPAGSGPNRTGNNGVCKAYMRGNCRVNKCKFIHPKKRL